MFGTEEDIRRESLVVYFKTQCKVSFYKFNKFHCRNSHVPKISDANKYKDILTFLVFISARMRKLRFCSIQSQSCFKSCLAVSNSAGFLGLFFTGVRWCRSKSRVHRGPDLKFYPDTLNLPSFTPTWGQHNHSMMR